MDLGVAPGRGRDLRGHPGGHDPVHRHQRGHDRRVAADLLDGPVPPAARPAAPAAPALPHARTWRSCVFGAIACLTIVPGQAEFLGKIYAFGAMLSFTIAHLVRGARCGSASPTSSGRTGSRGTCTWRGRRAAAAVGRSAAWARGSRSWCCRCSTSRCWSPASIWLALGVTGYVLYRRNQGLSLTQTTQGRGAQADRRARGRVRVGAGGLRGRRSTRGEAVATAAKLAARRRRGHPRAGHDHRAGQRADRRRDAGGGGQGAGGDRLGAGARRAARDRATGRGCAPGRRGRRIVQRGARDPGGRDRDAAAADGAPGARCSAGRSRPCWRSAPAG